MWTVHRNKGTVESIGDRIRRLREERGLSQRQLSGPGISNSYLSRIEKSERIPSLEAIRALARKLGVTPEYLERGAELTTREELELALADAELKVRLEPENQSVAHDFREIFALATDEGEDDVAAKALAALGMAFVAWGRPAQAIPELEAAIAHPLMEPEVVPDAYTSLAIAYRALGRPEDAAGLCERGLDKIHGEHEPLRMVFVTHLSHALSDAGRFAEAERVLRELETDWAQANPYERARLHWSLARVSAMQDKRRIALRHMRRAIDLLKGTEDTERLARAHMLCAEILLWSGTTAGVAAHLRTAQALLPAFSDTAAHGTLRGLEALHAARQRRFGEAREIADEALSLLPKPMTDRATALLAAGLAATAQRDFFRAEAVFDEVFDIVLAGRLWREAATVASAYSDACYAANDAERGKAWAARAEELSARAHSLVSAASAR